MTLTIKIGKFIKFLTCPFATWWKARKFFKRPRFIFYFGPMHKKYWYEGSEEFKIKPQYLYEPKGFIYFVSKDYIKWRTSKWFPILMESSDIYWKDKYDSPRYEHPGFFSILFGRNPNTAWQFAMIVKAPKIYHLIDGIKRKELDEDSYWESILWYRHYYDEYGSKFPDIKKAFNNCDWKVNCDGYTYSQFNELLLTDEGVKRVR